MGDLIPLPDGYGGHVGDPCALRAKPGAHRAYARGPDLVVEWYDFGPHAPFESVNLLIFDRQAQHQLGRLIEAPHDLTPHELAWRLPYRFASYFEVKAFAQANRVPFKWETSFDP